MSAWSLVSALVRDPRSLVEDGPAADVTAARSVLVGVLAAAVYAALVGGRLGTVWQAELVVAVPACLVGAVLVAMPGVAWLGHAAGSVVSWPERARTAAVWIGRAGVGLLALAPSTWLAWVHVDEANARSVGWSVSWWAAAPLLVAVPLSLVGLAAVARSGARVERVAAMVYAAVCAAAVCSAAQPWLTGPTVPWAVGAAAPPVLTDVVVLPGVERPAPRVDVVTPRSPGVVVGCKFRY